MRPHATTSIRRRCGRRYHRIDLQERLCPKCGAYWRCDCVIDAPPELGLPSGPACEHDWSEVVGVDLDDDDVMGSGRVLVCRLCGLYAVQRQH